MASKSKGLFFVSAVSAGVTAPNLVIHSPHDGDVPFANAEFSAGTIPNAEQFTVDAGGHFLWLGEDGKQVVERRSAFLK